MSVEDQLKILITSKYKNVKAFTEAADIKYTTFMSALNGSISNLSVSVAIRAASALGISTEDLLNEEKLKYYLSHTNNGTSKLEEHGKKKILFSRIDTASGKDLEKLTKLLEIIEDEKDREN